MKKIFMMAIALLVVGSVSAQRRYYGRSTRRTTVTRVQTRPYNSFYEPKIGFTGGVNFANTVSAYNSNYSTSNLTGFNAGIIFDLPILYPLSFAPEVLYSQKGHATYTNNGNFTQRTNFIDVPLLAKFKVGPIFNIYVGPQFSYLLNTTNTYDNGFVVTNQQYYENAHPIDRSILAGVAGVGFDLGRNVELRGRYTYDFTKTDYAANTYVPPFRNQVWQIGLGFKF